MAENPSNSITSVPIVADPDVSGLDAGYLQVLGLEVELLSSRKGVVVTLDHRRAPHQDPLEIVLSPPAAHLLSRELKKAVKAYLGDESTDRRCSPQDDPV